ncbi:MAG: hypothetical protein JWN18_66 [Parcubacteria group bacterium]|nr:hypothetical protein [Parcubacteria group bacterium]
MSGYFFYCATTQMDWHYIDYANLLFHEAGHTIFIFFGQFTSVLMGSGFQIVLPLSIALYFWITEQRFSAALCLMWVGQNLINVSVYAGDAITMQLPLLGGDSVIHDWNFLLSNLHILSWTPAVSLTLYGIGILSIGLGAILSLWFASTDE